MSEQLSYKTHEKINSLCIQISVAHNLDDDIREELRTHMEDKMLGYLKGDEKITEDDAFILVRKHFGKPSQVKKLLQAVYISTACPAFSGRFVGVLAVRG